MINVIIMPLVVLLFILLAVYLRKNMHKIMKPKIRKPILISYISLLIVATIIFMVIQPNSSEVKVVEEIPPYVGNLVHDHYVEAQLAPYEQNEWDVKVENQEIKIDTMFNGSGVDMYIPVVVFEDDSRESSATITYYETPTVLNNINISSYIKMIDVTVLNNSVLVDFLPLDEEYRFHSIKKDFILNQFNENSLEDMWYDIHLGEMAFVLYVPKETQVVADLQNFEVIRK